MAETENFPPEAGPPAGDGRVAVLVPLFPRLPGLRNSLASLAAQTRPPDVVVFLDDGKSEDAAHIAADLPGIPSEVLQTGTDSLASAINAAVKYLAGYEFVTFLLAGDGYAPERLASCLAAMEETESLKRPTTVISAVQAVDSRGQPLPDDEPRARHLARLWAPAEVGITPSEWVGTGNIAATASNLFLRRGEFADDPLPEIPGYLPYFPTASAAVQGKLVVIPAPLVSHNPTGREQQSAVRSAPDLLRAQLHLLATLRDKLADSPETRANFSAYHRAAWHNLSGLREDLFQQVALRLAAEARPEDALAIAGTVLRSHIAQSVPPQQQALLEGGDALDLTAYAAALERTRTQLELLAGDNARLRTIAEAAQGSGWVRFGAWLGDRSARRMMEQDAADGSPAASP